MLHQNTGTPGATAPTRPHGHRAKRRRRKSMPVLALNLAVVLVLAGGTAAYGALSQTITLEVDGKRDTVRTFGGTVADVLDDHGVVVRDGDRLNHRPSDPISDGDTIDVAFARPIQLTVDGVASEKVVFEPTVGRALASLGVAPAQGAYVSAKAAKTIPRAGMKLVVSTPKNVTVVADGQAKTLTTTRPTVGEVLDEAGVALDSDDEIQPAVDAFVAPDEKLRVVRIEKVEKTETVKVKHDTQVKEDPEALAGETEVVTPGKNGKSREQVTLVYADGKLRDRVVVASDPVSKPVTEVVSRGTSRTPPDSVWDKIAQCESGGNWKINSGNGYYGGLQFSAATWKSVGGPGLPHENSREVQIKYAKILQARSGWGQWGCAGARFN
ncbi:MAG: ubiquitin-like domain-containing protein [Aeromicrobium sp.]